jgi:hypothetical protein
MVTEPFIAAVYELSEPDLKNGYIRFLKAPFLFPKESVGGTNSKVTPSQSLDVTFVPGSTTKQFLYSDKKIFNNRNPATKDFFAAIGATIGTRILIERTGHSSISISKY